MHGNLFGPQQNVLFLLTNETKEKEEKEEEENWLTNNNLMTKTKKPGRLICGVRGVWAIKICFSPAAAASNKPRSASNDNVNVNANKHVVHAQKYYRKAAEEELGGEEAETEQDNKQRRAGLSRAVSDGGPEGCLAFRHRHPHSVLTFVTQWHMLPALYIHTHTYIYVYVKSLPVDCASSCCLLPVPPASCWLCLWLCLSCTPLKLILSPRMQQVCKCVCVWVRVWKGHGHENKRQATNALQQQATGNSWGIRTTVNTTWTNLLPKAHATVESQIHIYTYTLIHLHIHIHTHISS